MNIPEMKIIFKNRYGNLEKFNEMIKKREDEWVERSMKIIPTWTKEDALESLRTADELDNNISILESDPYGFEKDK